MRIHCVVCGKDRPETAGPCNCQLRERLRMADNQGIPFSTPDEGKNYPDIAKEIVYRMIKLELETLERHGTFSRDEVYVVWFVKALQNWKALVSTSLPDGRYYEVTFDGDKRVAYLDTYLKVSNQEIRFADATGARRPPWPGLVEVPKNPPSKNIFESHNDDPV